MSPPSPEEDFFRSRVTGVVDTFEDLLEDLPFEVDEEETTPTLKRERSIELPGPRTGGIFESRVSTSNGFICTYNLYVYSLLGDTGMGEIRYYHMEPTTQQMKVISVVTSHEDSDEMVGRQVEARYGAQKKEAVSFATPQDWEDFFQLVDEVKQNETG